jgi:hypothetical protein
MLLISKAAGGGGVEVVSPVVAALVVDFLQAITKTQKHRKIVFLNISRSDFV